MPDLSVESHRHRQAKRRFVRWTHEPNSELPAVAPDDAAASLRVSGTCQQEHELSRHDIRHARRIECKPRSVLRYVRQDAGPGRRSIAEIDVCAVPEITSQLLAFFSCHVVGAPSFNLRRRPEQDLASLQGTATLEYSNFQIFRRNPICFFYDQAIEKLSRKSAQHFANFCLLRLRRIHRAGAPNELSGLFRLKYPPAILVPRHSGRAPHVS
jgi:hypothetical protein